MTASGADAVKAASASPNVLMSPLTNEGTDTPSFTHRTAFQLARPCRTDNVCAMHRYHAHPAASPPRQFCGIDGPVIPSKPHL